MSFVPRQPTTEKCDRLIQECDRLVSAVDRLDFEVQALRNSAKYFGVQLALLGHAQAELEPQLRALSWRLFWSKLRMSTLLDRLTLARAVRFLRVWPANRPCIAPVGQDWRLDEARNVKASVWVASSL
jgi:hypothetical protein